MIRFSKHTALFFLFLFSGTLAGEGALAMHGITQITDNPAHAAKTTMYCAAGFLISDHVSEAEDPVMQKTDQTPPEQEKTVVTSNCHSSLQLLVSQNITPFVPEKSIPYDNFVLLISSQSFILEIADPPRA